MVKAQHHRVSFGGNGNDAAAGGNVGFMSGANPGVDPGIRLAGGGAGYEGGSLHSRSAIGGAQGGNGGTGYTSGVASDVVMLGTPEFNRFPPMVTDNNYTNAGVGGFEQEDGTHGLVVIQWFKAGADKCYVNATDPEDPTDRAFNDTIYDTVLISERDTITFPLVSPSTHDSIVIPTFVGPLLANASTLSYDDTSFVYDAGPLPGEDTIRFEICNREPSAVCDTITVFMHVVRNNQIPEVVDTNGLSLDTLRIFMKEDGRNRTPFSVNDIDGPERSTSVLISPRFGNMRVDTDTNIYYEPDPGYYGTDFLRLAVCDNGTPNYCDTLVYIYTISSLPEYDTINIVEETTDVSVFNIQFPNGPNYNNVAITPTSNGVFATVGDTAYTYTPPVDFDGTQDAVIHLCDPLTIGPKCDTLYIHYMVTQVNDTPVIITPGGGPLGDTIYVTLNEDEIDTTTFGIQDVDGPSVASSFFRTPDDGIATRLKDTVIQYAPRLNYSGQDTLTLFVGDGGSPNLFDTLTIVYTVLPVTDTTRITIPEEAKDTNELEVVYPNAPPLTSNVCDSGNHGDIIIIDDTLVVYCPDVNYNGNDTIKTIICDGTVPTLCDTFITIYTIDPVNDPPVIYINSNPTDTFEWIVFKNNKDSMCFNVQDVDGIDKIGAVFDAPDVGSLIQKQDTCIIYDPLLDYIGKDSLILTLCDDGTPNLCDTLVVNIRVLDSNQAPVIEKYGGDVDTLFVTLNEDEKDTTHFEIVDLDGPGGTTTIIDPPNDGTPTLLTDTSIEYHPDTNYYGPDTITVKYCDGGPPAPEGLCDTLVVVYTVNPINDPPIISDTNGTLQDTIRVTVTEDEIDTTCISVSDVDGALNVIAIIQHPINGSYQNLDDTCFIYNADDNYFGPDTIIVEVCDTGFPVLCDEVVIIYDVLPKNDTPVIVYHNDSLDTLFRTLFEDERDTLIYNVRDKDGPAINSSVYIPSNNGLLTYLNDTTLEYLPNLNYNGPDKGTILVCDGGVPLPEGRCDTLVIIYTILPVNDPPVILDTNGNPGTPGTPDTVKVVITEDHIDTTCITVNDVDGPSLDTSVIQPASNGTMEVVNDTCFIYHPDTNYNGPDTVIISICDNGVPNSLCDTIVLVYEVVPFNDPPVIWEDGVIVDTLPRTILEDQIDTICMSIKDPDGPTIIASINDSSNHGSITIWNDTCVIYHPDTNYYGPDTAIYVVCDGGTNPVQCDTLVIVWDIIPVNDPPVNKDTATYEGDPLPYVYDTTETEVPLDICFTGV